MRADKHTGERIRERREEVGLSQRALDEATSHSYAYISRIEAGTRQPSMKALIKIAKKLDTTALELLSGREDAECPLCGGQAQR